MLETLQQLDQDLFIWLNQTFHWEGLNDTMYWLSDRKFWYPFYGLFLAWVIYLLRMKSIAVILLGAISIVIADQISAGLFKPFFERPRPCHLDFMTDLIYLTPKGCGGKFGFVSSHAANSFAFATYFFLVFKGYIKWIPMIFVWAALVSYSRIYNGVHYPGDILGGLVIGIYAGLVGYWLLGVVKRAFGH